MKKWLRKDASAAMMFLSISTYYFGRFSQS
jgi:hypothetical protein